MENCIIGNLHLFRKSNNCFLFDGDSLRLFVLEDKNYHRLLKALECKSLNSINDELLNELKKEKLIFDNTEYEQKIKEIKNCDSVSNLTHLTLAISNDCNLNCRYCFGDGGTYHSDRKLMSIATAKKSIDFFVSNSGDAKVLSIIFFGGEPLLNYSVLKQVVDYCSDIEKKTEKRFKYSISTNGTIVNNDIIDLIKSKNISVTLSIDGPQEIHDLYRMYINGTGSFETIRVNIDKLIGSSIKRLSGRATICKGNSDVNIVENAIRHLGLASVHMTPVDVFKDSPLFMDDDAIERAIRGYCIIAEDYIEGIKLKKNERCKVFDDVLSVLYRKKLKLRSCGAAISNIAVNAIGDIYPCHRFMGDKDYIIGNLDDGLFNDQVVIIAKLNVLNIKGCCDCWARFLCAGSCVHSRTKHSRIDHVMDYHCKLYKAFYEIALYVYFELKQYDKDIFSHMDFI